MVKLIVSLTISIRYVRSITSDWLLSSPPALKHQGEGHKIWLAQHLLKGQVTPSCRELISHCVNIDCSRGRSQEGTSKQITPLSLFSELFGNSVIPPTSLKSSKEPEQSVDLATKLWPIQKYTPLYIIFLL